MSDNKGAGVVLAVGALFAVLLTGLLGVALIAPAAAGCAGAAVSVAEQVPDVDVDGLSNDEVVRSEQLENAASIMAAASALALPRRAQEIGVMTALGESSLRILDYGDAAGPDSRGLFQQRDNGAWGSYEDRMDATRSATNFFLALQGVQGWEQLAPTIAAHRVQRNADPYYYEQFWPTATAVVTALSGVVDECAAGSGAPVSAQGWTKPLTASPGISSTFGMRLHPIDHVWRLHAGTDLRGSCGTPIYAAAAGTVVSAAGSGVSKQRDLVSIDHGGGLSTNYMHMYASGIFAHVGDQVAAGDLIAQIGNAGSSTACHLHFEVRQNGTALDPVPFLAARGVDLP